MASEGQILTGIAVRIIAKNGGRIGRSELLDALVQDDAFLREVPEGRRSEVDATGRLKLVGQLDHHAGRFAKEIIGKENRQWFLTDEGLRITRDDKGEWLPDDEIPQAYDKWLKDRGRDAVDEPGQGGDAESPPPTQEQLDDGIVNHIKKQDPKKNTGVWFEGLVVALLRGMGYQHVDPCGGTGDGGVDVIAYKDKLGATLPRIKVQAKHHKGEKPTPIPEEVIQKLASNVHDGEIGMCVTSSSFSKNAKIFARTCCKHLELVDIDRLVLLWKEHYHRMTEADKDKLPLKYVLDTDKVRQAGKEEQEPDAAD